MFNHNGNQVLRNICTIILRNAFLGCPKHCPHEHEKKIAPTPLKKRKKKKFSRRLQKSITSGKIQNEREEMIKNASQKTTSGKSRRKRPGENKSANEKYILLL